MKKGTAKKKKPAEMIEDSETKIKLPENTLVNQFSNEQYKQESLDRFADGENQGPEPAAP